MIDQISPSVHSKEESDADLVTFTEKELALIKRKVDDALAYDVQAKALGLI